LSNLTPMMRQYERIKAQHEDKLLFFRLGDFYELFMDDAEEAARELEITLTGREVGGGNRVPMCGVPHHSADSYIGRLVEKGYRVAICEQVEDPREARGIVRREVVRVVTPGTITDLEALDSKSNNFIVALTEHRGSVGLAAADVSTGEFRVTRVAPSTPVTNRFVTRRRDSSSMIPQELLDELQRINASEIVVPDNWSRFDSWHPTLVDELNAQFVRHPGRAFGYRAAYELLTSHFATPTLAPYGCEDEPASIRAAGGLLDYLIDTQKAGLQHITSLVTYNLDQSMVIDTNTRRNLELTRRIADGSRKGSLLWVLDHTVTAMGGRRLRGWVEQPLVNPADINARLDAVQELVGAPFLREDLQTVLRDIYDIERLTARTAYGSATPRELTALRQSLQALPALKGLLDQAQCRELSGVRDDLDLLDDITQLLERGLTDDPPTVVTEGGIIREGYNDEVDRLRTAQREGTQWIARLQKTEREETGIKSLKVGFNKVFGYYIEVTKPNIDLVPEHYERKQTLANSERYITPELKEKEAAILGAEDRLSTLEYELFVKLRSEVAAAAARLGRTARAVAHVDAILSLAEAAVANRYVRPRVDGSRTIDIRQGRHPVLEHIQDEPFVPNDCRLDAEEHRVVIITGPNMAGKSTYMRQAALTTLMAQLGSFVPAEAAQVGVVDRIFSRVGASDDLSRGQSTFMVEMVEVSHILRHATDRSLIILDEVGRGTSTYDGMALAQAVVEHIHRHSGARTLCSTHYHELTSLADHEEGIYNLRTEVAEQGEDIVFLYQVKPGRAERSYGINVARLAQLPTEVLERAKELLRRFEEQATLKEQVAFAFMEHAASGERRQPGRAHERHRELLREFASLDLLSMSPLELMNWAYDYQLEVQRLVSEGEGGEEQDG